MPALADPFAIDLRNFSERIFTTYPTVNGVRYTVNGTVDELFIDNVLISQVPEPSALHLIGVVTLMTVTFRRAFSKQYQRGGNARQMAAGHSMTIAGVGKHDNCPRRPRPATIRHTKTRKYTLPSSGPGY